MSLFDLIFAFALPRVDGDGRSREENIAAGISTVVFPVAAFSVVFFAGAWKHAGLSLVAIPALLTAVSVGINRLLGNPAAWTIRVALVCALGCFMGAGCGFLLGIFMGFFSAF